MAGKTVAAVVKLIDQFTNPSKQVQTASKNVEKRFNEMAKTFKNAGAVMESAGAGLTKTITGPVAAIGTASVAAFNEVDGALDTITKKTGATGDAMKDFQKVFENVSTTVPADMDSVGAAVGEINTRLGFTGKTLEDASSQFLKFAELNGMDVESSIQLVSRAMGDAGIAAEDYGSVLDKLNVAGQVSGISMDKLAENLAKYGAPMRALGLDTDTAIAMFSGWEKAGVNTEIAFSGMKKAISNWGKEGKDAGVEFSKTMQKIKDAPDIASATSMAIEAFGAKAGPDLADAIKGGRFEVDEYVKALQNAGGSVNNTFEGTIDGVDGFKTASNALKIALGELGGEISTAIGPFLNKFTDKVKKATQWFKNLDDGTKKNILRFGAMAAAAGPLLTVFGKITTGTRNLIISFGKVSGLLTRLSGGATGFKALSVVMTGPVGIAIAGVAAGALLIYKNWDKISPIIQKISGRFQEFWKNVQPKLQPFFDFIEKVAGYLKATFKPVIDEVFAFAGEFVVGAFEAIGLAIDGLLTGFEKVIDFLSGVFSADWKKVWSGCKDFIGDTFSTIADAVKIPINAVINVVNGAIDKINSIKFTVPEWVPGIGGKGWDGLGIPHIPQLAKGTDNWQGGIVQVNEQGGEIIDLPKGSRVYPHDESVRMAKEEGKRKISVAIAKLADQIIVREDADIDRIAEAVARKIVEVSANMA